MTSYVDLKYLMIASPQLERFSAKGESLYNCRCPICGDSSKNKLKARGYFYETPNGYYYKCHNCSYGSSFSNFLKLFNATLYSDYSLEKIGCRNSNIARSIKKIESNNSFKSIGLLSAVRSIDDVTRYCITRGMGIKQLRRVYSCPNFRHWAVERFGQKYEKVSDSKKLILPFFDLNGNLVGAQARSINPLDKLRYETAKHPDVEHIVFGLDRWNRNKLTKIVEGPIDSLFVENSIAMASSDLKRVKKVLPSLDIDNTVFCWDNEPRNKEIVKLIESAIESNLNVFLWPDTVPCKDFNDAANIGLDIEDMIANNTFSGISAKLKFVTWSKI